MDGNNPVKPRFIRKNFTFPEDFMEKFSAIKKQKNLASDSEVLRAAINYLYEKDVEEVRKAKDAVEHALSEAAE